MYTFNCIKYYRYQVPETASLGLIFALPIGISIMRIVNKIIINNKKKQNKNDNFNDEVEDPSSLYHSLPQSQPITSTL